MITAARAADAIPTPVATGPHTTGPIALRSTSMQQLIHEDLARAHLSQRLADAEEQRLATYVVRLARARRQARRARRHAEQAQLRLGSLAG